MTTSTDTSSSSTNATEGEVRLLIDGALTLAEGDRRFDNVNPATEEVLGQTADATPADMDRAIAAAGGRLSFDTIVQSGPNSAQPHLRPSARRIEAGDLVLLDFGADAEKVRNEVIRMLSGPGRRARPASGGWIRHAPHAPAPRSWEYHLESWPPADGADRVELLNRLGAEGWALAGIAGAEFVFQRPGRPPEAPAQPGEPAPD